MNYYFAGQRWISETEPELGLGLVVDITPRTVQLFYQAANEMRHYSIKNAPLKRVEFLEGDEITSREGTRMTIEKVAVEPHSGLRTYIAADGTQLRETELCDTSSFDKPEMRLLAGHVETNELFELRVEALTARHHYGILPVRGLLGGRVDLLPHQLYIAKEVSERHLPRVLLADEVGLGKTIEACLILHRLMVCGLIRRVLILLPNALVHQWFVELLRRFNLSFCIYNEDRCLAIEEHNPGTNPFLDDQLIIASIDFLAGDPTRAAQANGCDWDLLIVDEAHHLHWSPEHSSPEYTTVERLAKTVKRLLLLTASPEQMGLESHFARLHLLDPQRYPHFEGYKKEHEGYQEVAATLTTQLETMSEAKRSELLDRHGPGRIIFRNTRKCMTGFPKRIPDLVPLELAEGIKPLSAEDPRIGWLVAFLTANPTEKVLVICKTRAEVTALTEAIRTRSGVDIAHFHEAMPLVQCDRQAAWFAEPEGARVMVVSEIGGEGRNFQVASHLVLIDLPRDPELLEQRIGRLDRIGQRGDVHIHVPYLINTPEEQIVRWLHEGLNAFHEPVVGGFELLERFEPKLQKVTKAVITETRRFYAKLRNEIETGRDRLLELSSFRPQIGNAIAEQIRACEASKELQDYLLRIFERYGINCEPLDNTSYHIRPDRLFVDFFPLKAEGIRITFDRDVALSRPDTTLISWDHPMVTGASELILGSEHGNCAMVVDPAQEIPLKLQAVYVLETVAPPALNADRFLPPTPIIMTVDHVGSPVQGPKASQLKDSDPWTILEHESIRQQLIPSMIEATRTLAEAAAKTTVSEARHTMQLSLGADYKRLVQLQQVNDNIREAELIHARKAMEKLDKKLSEARLRLDSIRIISPA